MLSILIDWTNRIATHQSTYSTGLPAFNNLLGAPPNLELHPPLSS